MKEITFSTISKEINELHFSSFVNNYLHSGPKGEEKLTSEFQVSVNPAINSLESTIGLVKIELDYKEFYEKTDKNEYSEELDNLKRIVKYDVVFIYESSIDMETLSNEAAKESLSSERRIIIDAIVINYLTTAIEEIQEYLSILGQKGIATEEILENFNFNFNTIDTSKIFFDNEKSLKELLKINF